ncbi:CurL C-terminal domain-containing protein, partial [Frankia sp. AgKG'84/4]
EAPAAPTSDEDSETVIPLVLSARGEQALAGQAARLERLLASDAPPVRADTAAALVTRRARLPRRAVVVSGSREQARAGLGALARGEARREVVTGRAGGAS